MSQSSTLLSGRRPSVSEVNAAPAVKGVDIRIAMGKGDTEITRQAANIITDENSATVVAAVEEGRGFPKAS